MITPVTSGFEKNMNVLERRLSFVQGFDENSVETHHMEHILYRETVAAVAQGEGPPVCYYVRKMDCTVHGISASKFPLLQKENLIIELLRAV